MSTNISKFGLRSLESMSHRVPPATRTTGKGTNYHKSNRAKNGLFHGKDVLFGHSISHSHKLSKKKWCPNVINKRVWSDTLDNWVRFKMTTAALKAIDHSGMLKLFN
jgi:ribosomal protein L28